MIRYVGPITPARLTGQGRACLREISWKGLVQTTKAYLKTKNEAFGNWATGKVAMFLRNL
jgi:hypothetical protein